MDLDMETSRATGPHALLGQLVGRWRGTARLWLEPDVLTSEDPVAGRVESALAGRFVRHDYSLTIDGDPHAGTALIGCTLTPANWQVAWADTFHTGSEIMLSTGPVQGAARSVEVLGSYAAPDGPAWGWRTTLARQDERLLVRHFNITPDGQAALAVEFDYLAD